MSALQPAMEPKVSILMPILNGIRFLPERIESIRRQSLSDWELISVDGLSTDGSWEMLRLLTTTDARIRVEQKPPQGIYDALNRCLSQARGKYIYIAMADDAMTPDCLERMAQALDRTPKAGIAHCNLGFIDENSQPIDDTWEELDKVKYYGRWIHHEHVRIAPHDGVLYCVLGTMYASLTQLLMRRSVFARVGPFKTTFGSAGDFEWGMRAAWLESTVHVPHTLATWRIHSLQATKDSFVSSAEGRRQRCEMIKSARRSIARVQETGRLPSARLLSYVYRMEQLGFSLAKTPSRLRRRWILFCALCTHPWVCTMYLIEHVSGRHLEREAAIRKLFGALNLNPAELLVDIPTASPPAYENKNANRI
jgi:GT2 family glycosyltransferase